MISFHWQGKINLINIVEVIKEKIILGIDPGTSVTGYGLIKQNGNQMELIVMGIIQMKKLDNHALKLKMIFERVLMLIDEYKPDCMAIEAPFFAKNVQSMLKLGRAQGVAMTAALYREVPIEEFSPRKIKQSITGNGNSSKEQVAAMLKTLLNFKETPEFLDATDGLAAAVCMALQNPMNGMGKKDKKVSGWAAFIKENPKRKI